MTDREKREKVIGELELCLDDAVAAVVPSDTVQDAIDLLKAQEPVAPKRIDKYTRTKPITFVYKCAVCTAGLLKHWVCCPICGTAVKWE